MNSTSQMNAADFRHFLLTCLLCVIAHCSFTPVMAQSLTLVELNAENLFDYKHDSLKQDEEFLPESTRRWTRKRYWRKLNNIAQELLSCREDGIPDLIALCEVENDAVMQDLTKRSLLRNAGYEYLMTESPDQRGIDVALVYSPFAFRPISHYSLRVPLVGDMRPTRDILYVCGQLQSGDTLHVFVVHAPSRYGGEHRSRPFRKSAADRLCLSLDSIRAVTPDAHILVTGDFNDFTDSPSLQQLYQHQLHNLTSEATGQNGVRGTYRFQGEWDSLDHVLASPSMQSKVEQAFIHSPLFLLEEDERYGGYIPRCTYNGMRYQATGYSDHLPLVVRFRLN